MFAEFEINIMIVLIYYIHVYCSLTVYTYSEKVSSILPTMTYYNNKVKCNTSGSNIFSFFTWAVL